MATKYYVVWKGRTPGIYTDWNSCKAQVDQFPAARYKSFKTRSEAEAAFRQSPATASPASKSDTSKSASQAKAGRGQSLATLNEEQVQAVEVDTKIFTDGACEPNPGEAGSGIAIYRDGALNELWTGLYHPVGTNNTAELNALYQALCIASEEINNKRTVAIFCDSKYSIQCVTQWAVGWEKKGWKKNGGEIKNLAIIKQSYELYQTIKSRIQIHHVNGHVGIEGNELADRMSMLAISHHESEFKKYTESMDIESILSMRHG